MRADQAKPDRAQPDALPPASTHGQGDEHTSSQRVHQSRSEVAAFIKRARNAISTGKTELAYEESDKAVKTAPRSSRAWNTMGRAELSRPNYIAAVAAFEKAVELNPNNIWAWNNLGYVELLLGRYGDAARHLAQATKSEAATGYMFNNLGLALERCGELDKARTEFEKGAALGSKEAAASRQRLEGVKAIRPTSQALEPKLPAAFTKSIGLSPTTGDAPERDAPHENQKGDSALPAPSIDNGGQPATEESRRRAYEAYIALANRKKSVLELAQEEQAHWLKETLNSSNIISILIRELRRLWNPDAENTPMHAPGHDHGGHTHGPGEPDHEHSHGPDEPDHEHSHDLDRFFDENMKESP